MNVVSIIIWIVVSVACAIIHKNKGYSPVTGFLWGFFFSVIGLIVILLEKDKQEHDMYMANNHGLSVGQWIGIFVGIGVVLIILFFVIMNIIK